MVEERKNYVALGSNRIYKATNQMTESKRGWGIDLMCYAYGMKVVKRTINNCNPGEID